VLGAALSRGALLLARCQPSLELIKSLSKYVQVIKQRLCKGKRILGVLARDRPSGVVGTFITN
jgi:hypothetical protein